MIQCEKLHYWLQLKLLESSVQSHEWEAALRVVVCTKEVPDTAAKVEVKDGKVTWGDAPLVINPWDEYSVEEAILLKEQRGADAVTVIGMGGDATKEALKHALAMGVDDA